MRGIFFSVSSRSKAARSSSTTCCCYRRTIAVEVKWTDRPSLRDVTGLVSFLRDHPRAGQGFVIGGALSLEP
jgi:hypothetical protein